MEEEVLFEYDYEGEEEEYEDASEEEEVEDGSNLDDMFLVLQDQDDNYAHGGGESFNLIGESDNDDDDDNETDSLAQEVSFATASFTTTANNNDEDEDDISHEKTIRFSETVQFIDEESSDNDDNDDDDDDEDNNNRRHRLAAVGVVGGTAAAASAAIMTNKGSTSTTSESDVSQELHENGEEEEVDKKEKEQEHQMVKTLLFAGFGFGAIALTGMGAKKIMSVFGKSSTPAQQAAAMNGQPQNDLTFQQQGEQPSQIMTANSSFNDSMTSSEENESSRKGGFYAPRSAMKGAQ
jgi:hypothetical protein